jgi:hypothetical protein
MTNLQELLERVEKATGEDRQLDGDILKALIHPNADMRHDGDAYWLPDVEMHGFETPYYTSSIDAALSLVEEKLPGWGYDLHGGGADRKIYVTLWHADEKSRFLNGRGATLPLALLNALLRALISKEEKNAAD